MVLPLGVLIRHKYNHVRNRRLCSLLCSVSHALKTGVNRGVSKGIHSVGPRQTQCVPHPVVVVGGGVLATRWFLVSVFNLTQPE